MRPKALNEGDVFRVRYPFCRASSEILGEEGVVTVQGWKPGTYAEGEDPFSWVSTALADGVGLMILTVVSTHKPGKYPARVFYTRRWIDPDGREFGCSGLRVLVESKFRRFAAGYQHAVEVRDRGVSHESE